MERKTPSYLVYKKHFTPPRLWKKVEQVAHKAGVKLVYAVLLLYYVAVDPKTSWSDRTKIFGALGYFILPFDIIPDPSPILGYSDDMAALLWALKAIWSNLSPAIHLKAKTKLKQWFKDLKEEDLKIF